jgi:hypothetical protein
MDSGLNFSWPCSRPREVLGVGCCKAEAPRPCSRDKLAVVAKLLEEQEIPEAKIWLYAGLSAFLFLYMKEEPPASFPHHPHPSRTVSSAIAAAAVRRPLGSRCHLSGPSHEAPWIARRGEA